MMNYVNESETHSIGWGTIGTLLRRYRWVILSVFLITVITGWGVLQIFFTELYQTQAVVLVKVGRETSEVPSTVVNGSLLSQGVRIQDINSEVQMLSSPGLVEAAVDKIGPERFKSVLKAPDSIWSYPKYGLRLTARFFKDTYKEILYMLSLKKRLSFREEIISGVTGALKVEPVKESDVLVLKLPLPSAELAKETANEILTGYLRLRAEVRRNAAERAYFAGQTRLYRAQMQDLSVERAKVRDTWGLSSAAEQRTLLLKQLSELESEQIGLDGQIRKVERERQDMQSKLLGIPAHLTKEETFTRNPALHSLKERITNLQMERAKLLGRYQPTSEFISQIETEIESLEHSLKNETPTVLLNTTSENNPIRRDYEKGVADRQIGIAGMQTRLRKLDETITERRKRISELNQAGDAIEPAERDYGIAEKSYLSFYKRMGEARLSEEMDARNIANVSVISPPNLPIEPIYPRKLFIMGILLPVALLLGIGFSALLETMNDRVRDETDLLLIAGVQYLGSVENYLPRRLGMRS